MELALSFIGILSGVFLINARFFPPVKPYRLWAFIACAVYGAALLALTLADNSNIYLLAASAVCLAQGVRCFSKKLSDPGASGVLSALLDTAIALIAAASAIFTLFLTLA